MLPCPFCGCEVISGETTSGHYDSCFFTIIHQRGVSAKEEDSAWNRRRGELTMELQRVKNNVAALMHVACGMATTWPEMTTKVSDACLQIQNAIETIESA
jgi:hypothetical protein